MKTLFETKRTYFRELNSEDAQSFYELNLDKDVIKYTGDLPFLNQKEAKIFLENYNHYQKYGYGRWAVIDKNTSDFLGWCGLKFNPETNETDLGFRFFKKYWNQGFATETAKSCINYGFEKLDLNRIIGRAMTENSASIQVLKKCGMRHIGNTICDLHTAELFEIINPKIN